MEHQSTPTITAVNSWMTVKEFAQATRSPISTVYYWVGEGIVPSSRIGQSIRIPRSALEAFERGEAMA